MPNSIRFQPIWLPQGTPDATNISPTDWGPSATNAEDGGQPGELGQKFDYNDRVYQRVRLDSGADATTPVGVSAANQICYWKDKNNYIVTNNRDQAIGGSGTASYNNFVAGVIRLAATAGRYIDILKAGDNIPLADGGNTFAVGEKVIGESAAAAAVDRIAVGTAVTFNQIGIARGASDGTDVNVDVDIDVEHQ
jgi:hypothetical protein|tara:strand:+ start:173 stop:754 length:582 start_codon:yes stop_codon:yes gene_type:complete